MKAALSRERALGRRRRATGACIWLATCLPAVAMQALAQTLTLSQRIELPRVTGRIDHMDIDLAGNRLFVAALAFDSVEIVDLRTGRDAESLPRMHGPQGLVYLAQSHRVVVANGEGNDVQAFLDSGPHGEPRATARGLDDADNMRLDPKDNRLYVGYAHALGFLDPATLQLVKSVPLSGHPEAFELEHDGPRIFVNVPGAGHVAVVDRHAGKVVQTWNLGGLSGNFPMALDEADHRLFVATRVPARLMAYDTSSGKRVAELSLCGDADDLFYDGARKQLYAVCGEGVVDIIRQASPDRYELAEQVATTHGARTGLFVPTTSTLFVAAPAGGGLPAEIRVYRIK